MNPVLTIAIPTYNRAAQLQAQLERLHPQLTGEVVCRVYDNASPDATPRVVEKFPGIHHIRAVANLGAGQNFFRCHEECQTEWLWILADDDPIAATAVADLLALLRHETADYVHTSFHGRRYAADATVTDLPAFLRHSENIGDLLWITSGVYRNRVFRPLFRIYNEAIFTCASQVIVVLSLLESGKAKVHLTPLCLVTPGYISHINWSTLDVLARICLLPEFLTDRRHQALVADALFANFFSEALLMGLRETATTEQIRKWRRIARQSRGNLRAYGARSLWALPFSDPREFACRQSPLRMTLRALREKILSRAPAGLFHLAVRLMPLPPYVRENYARRGEFVPYF